MGFVVGGRRLRFWALGAVALLLLGAGGAFLHLRARLAVDGWYQARPVSAFFTENDAKLLGRFVDTTIPASERYRVLFDYFLAGFLEFATPTGERVHYAGLKGNKGHAIEGLEGFTRTAPLFAAWLASGRPAVVPDPRRPDRTVDLRLLLRKGVLAGTDPASPVYWGGIGDYDQRFVEAADLALLLWLSRDQVWSGFSAAEREQVAGWLRQVEGRAAPHNNWMLFRVQVIETLRALGMPADGAASAETYRQFKELYIEKGWFRDPPKGVDYYNAWAISYALFWIDQMNPAMDRDFIRQALAQSGDLTLHLIGPQGPPMMGRSLCYRMAVPAPVVLQAGLDPQSIDPGQARRALDAVWLHFVGKDGLSQGRARQGYYGPDPRLLDRYSGPGSCQWSLRSLVPAFLQPADSAFWLAPERPLPVETGDYRLDLPKLGWVVEGHRDSGDILIRIPANGDRRNAIVPQSLWRRTAEQLLATPFRPRNDPAKYGDGEYSTAAPFALRD